MRDPNRLYDFYQKLQTVHINYFPDWRFGQFMYNFFDWYGQDPFFLEEDKFLELLDKPKDDPNQDRTFALDVR